jgi:hypothetical protein
MPCTRFLERLVIKEAIADLLAHGFLVTVFDGEQNTDCIKSNDPLAIFLATHSTDEDFLLAYKPDGTQAHGWIRLIYGNSGFDVINDYTTNLEPILARTMALISEMQA